MKKKYYIETQGCQMNEYDSDKMKDLLSQNLGFQSAKNKEEADKGSVSHARVLHMRNLIKIREEERLFKKAERAGIRASGEITKLPPLKPDSTINFKLLVDKNPALKSRYK